MPWGDGTGPMGYGPMTGRAAGYCAGNQMLGYSNPVFRRGMRRSAYYATPGAVYTQGYVPYGPAGYSRRPGRPVGFGRGYGFGRGRGWFCRDRGFSYGRVTYGW